MWVRFRVGFGVALMWARVRARVRFGVRVASKWVRVRARFRVGVRVMVPAARRRHPPCHGPPHRDGLGLGLG